ncbi:hypothetical protein ACOKFD_15750 [Flagellimonas sp. S174]|uniref:hypothetical protein n=1 Tax=Flagellimonas sp. S174 TaxID=3410790 RepID=UPI003BF4E0AB
MITPFGIANPPSVERTDPSVYRTPPSVYRTPLYKVLDRHLDRQERDTRASWFLFQNYQSELEAFWMQNGNMVENPEKFFADFDDTVELEEIKFGRKLFARLRKWTRNWLDFQNRKKKDNGPLEQSVSQKVGKRLA